MGPELVWMQRQSLCFSVFFLFDQLTNQRATQQRMAGGGPCRRAVTEAAPPTGLLQDIQPAPAKDNTPVRTLVQPPFFFSSSLVSLAAPAVLPASSQSVSQKHDLVMSSRQKNSFRQNSFSTVTHTASGASWDI